jgi:AraC family transcriptional regulator, transcriptional activator of pobA
VQGNDTPGAGLEGSLVMAGGAGYYPFMSREPRVRADDAHGWVGPVSVAQRALVAHRPVREAVTHDYVALAFYTAGSATIEQRGAWSLRPGDMMLVPAGEPHRLVVASDVELWGLGFCPVCFLADGSETLLEPFERVRYGASAVVTIPEERRGFLESLFRELRREVEGGQEPGALAVQKSLLTLIVAEAARARTWHAHDSAGNGLVADALGFIERRCLEPISLRDVAAAVARSPAYLTTAVKRATGRSVQAWIIAGRLSEARRRLVHSDEPIEVIAERVGYADATHFIRMFRRMHGATPAAWRTSRRTAAGAAKP